MPYKAIFSPGGISISAITARSTYLLTLFCDMHITSQLTLYVRFTFIQHKGHVIADPPDQWINLAIPLGPWETSIDRKHWVAEKVLMNSDELIEQQRVWSFIVSTWRISAGQDESHKSILHLQKMVDDSVFFTMVNEKLVVRNHLAIYFKIIHLFNTCT